ncbi:hypothetical protein SEA_IWOKEUPLIKEDIS_85 [Mycobacterium phage Iwokeuplikedis]|nr:hypothetical protein SEA_IWOKEUPLIKEDIS_85 [Mycobacterium phage Iwokeuplikedis]
MKVTPEAAEKIAHIEKHVTAWYHDMHVDWPDLLDKALSLAGLMITVDSTHNKACIQEL